jgi:serine/threonine-protein kinase
MPSRVTLKVTAGKLAGQVFTFDERTSCIIGRAGDCHPRIPNDMEHATISRHHCLLDVNPPDVRVRDFGSLNGTWVNGKKIGQREKGMTPEEGAQMKSPEYDLKDGDEVKLCGTVFRVSIYVPAVCAECSREIPQQQRALAQRAPGVYQCEECRQKAEKAGRKELPKKKAKVCAKCGRDVSDEVGDARQGDYVCSSCRADPLQLVRLLLELAKSGQKDLVAIEDYTIEKELGRGGMGAVYLARHDKTGRRVALKVMLPRVAADKAATEKFLRETENTKALKHANVVQLHDAGCSNATFFFTMEFCDGGSVDRLMRTRGGRLPLDEAMGIIFQALDGLEYAHHAEIPRVKLADGTFGRGYGLVHRDLKPGNIFLSGTGGSPLAKIGDYGLAKAFDLAGLSGQTMSGTAMGSPWFMPRQQIRNFKYAKPDVDVWAMAACLYSMLTAMFPRDFPEGKDVWQVVLQSKPVPILERDRSIPKKLARVIDLALVDDPAIHFESAAEFKRALEDAV